MARDFDGANDQIAFGSDASIDNFVTKSISFWARSDTGASAFDEILNKSSAGGGSTGWFVAHNTFNPVGARLSYQNTWSGTDGAWHAPDFTGYRHVCITYDGGNVANVPIIYIDGVAQTLVVGSTPTGTLDADAAHNLLLGEDAGGSSDWDGALAHLCYHDAIFTAADVNRARWWGRPHGGLKVYHPFLTDKVANEGSATANGTVTGSAMAAAAIPVQRPGTAMMGMGVGW